MNLSKKFFVESEDGDVYLVIKEDYSDCYWMQIDFTYADYEPCEDTSGTINEKDLIEDIQTGHYKIIPEEQGFINFVDLELQELEDEE